MSGRSATTPGVDVVIPCYKQAHLLGEAIRSCLLQRPGPARIIVVDDGSPDNVAGVVNGLSAPGLELVRRRNGGLSAARNTGLVASTSPFIVFLDSDDRLLPGALGAGLAAHAANPGCAFVWGGFQNIDATGRPFGRQQIRRPAGDPFVNLLGGNIIGMHGAVMYRRARLLEVGGFDESLRAVEDWDMYLRLAEAHKVAWHEVAVAEYRRYGQGMTSDFEHMMINGLRMLERFRPDPAAARDLREAWRRGRVSFVARILRKAARASAASLGQGDVARSAKTLRIVAAYLKYLAPGQPAEFEGSGRRQTLRGHIDRPVAGTSSCQD